jgi:HSP20 family protein
MRLANLIPWRRRSKKTKVPIKVREPSAPVSDRDADPLVRPLARWTGLAPFGAFGRWTDLLGPRMDMVENDQTFKVMVEVPGMDEDDIEVTLSGERLTVRGKAEDEEEHRGRGSYSRYRTQRAFRRSILMPCQVDPDQAEASLRKGVLTISLPKVTRGRSQRRIAVRRG